MKNMGVQKDDCFKINPGDLYIYMHTHTYCKKISLLMWLTKNESKRIHKIQIFFLILSLRCVVTIA